MPEMSAYDRNVRIARKKEEASAYVNSLPEAGWPGPIGRNGKTVRNVQHSEWYMSTWLQAVNSNMQTFLPFLAFH